jgi:hypothetical protein
MGFGSYETICELTEPLLADPEDSTPLIRESAVWEDSETVPSSVLTIISP